jgi:hypothetical protein
MWNKHEDPQRDALLDLASKEIPDLSSLGDALVQSLVNESLLNDQFKKGLAVVPQKVLPEDQNPSLQSPSIKTYTEAVNEFTKNATAFIEQLPLLAKARTAYEEAVRASIEIRKALDVGEENLRTLKTQLEQGLGVHGVKPAPDKKSPEPAKVERMRGTDEGGGRATRLP